MTITLRKNKIDSLSWDEMDTNFETLRDAMPPPQFVNLCPAAGLPANRDSLGEIPVYADFTFSRKESVTPTPVMVDREDQEVMFVIASNGKLTPQVYRAVRSSNTQPFIYSNTPIRTPWMAPTEVMAALFNLSTNSAYVVTLNTANSTYKYYVINIKGSSDASTWTDYIDITAHIQSIPAATAPTCIYDPASDRVIIMYFRADSQVWMRAIDRNLQVTCPERMLFDCRVDCNWIDHSGAWESPVNERIIGYALGTMAATYDATSETLYFVGRVQSRVLSLIGNSNTYTSAPYCCSWALPRTVLVNNSGTMTNLLPYSSTVPANYNVWDWTSLGIFNIYGHAGFTIGFDDYYKAIYVCGNGYWDNGSGFNVAKLSAHTRLPNINVATVESSTNMSIPDASMWAKGVNQSILIMGDYIQFCGANSTAINNIEAKFSTTQFDTRVTPNDTIVMVPNTERPIQTVQTAAEVDALSYLNRLTTIVSAAKVPTYYTCLGPGSPILQITQGADGVKRFIPTGVVLPPFPPNKYTWFLSWGWNGNIADPTFFYHVAPINQPVEMTNFSRIAKYHGGVWTESEVLARNFWESSRDSIGTATLGWSLGTVFSAASQKFIFGFVVSVNGGVHPPLVMTMSSDMTVSPPIALDDSYVQIGIANSYLISYHPLYGYYMSNASLSLGGGKAASIRTSKNFGVDAAELTESQFFEEGQRYVRYITIAPATGLIAYVLPYPLLLGGYFSYIPKMDVVLEPNSVNYIYLRRSPTDSTKVVVLVLQNQLLPNSFSRVLAAKVTTNATAVVSSEMTPF